MADKNRVYPYITTMSQSPHNPKTKCPYTKFMNFLWKVRNSEPKRVCYRIMLIAPLICLAIMLVIIGADMIYSCGLYGGSNLWEALNGFRTSLTGYTPQSVKAEGELGYFILGIMIIMVIWFPKWVISQYTK
jgi:hypothetical protein